MIKKNSNERLAFIRPMSKMRIVLSAIEQGYQYRHDIVKETKLQEGQVRSALFNLTFIGAIKLTKDASNRTVYLIPGQWAAEIPHNLRGIRSIFDTALPVKKL